MTEDPENRTTGSTTPTNGGKSWHPITFALSSMVIVAAMYEPARQTLMHVQDKFNFGGVGGVGGMSNLAGWNKFCTNASKDFGNKYCYEKGSVGPFTPMQIGVTILWVGPLVFACWTLVARGFLRSMGGVRRNNLDDDSSSAAPSHASEGASIHLLPHLWYGLNILWFVLPMLSYGYGLHRGDQAIQGSPVIHIILTVGLAASHPLSWNLSLVALPTGGFLSKLLTGENEDTSTISGDTATTNTDMNTARAHYKKQWFTIHRLLGYTTVFWGILHGSCELFYLSSTSERFRSFYNIAKDGEVLLYWAGLTTFLLLATHWWVAYRRPRYSSFSLIHRAGAGAVLLGATVHWWPFCFFLVPTAALYGMSWADHDNAILLAGDDIVSTAHLAGLSSVVLIAAVLLLYPVWAWREIYMMSPHANLYVPFIFPPLGLLGSFAMSWGTTRMWLYCVSHPFQEESSTTPTPAVASTTFTSNEVDEQVQHQEEEKGDSTLATPLIRSTTSNCRTEIV
jgi:hypothetical protein